MSLKAPLPLKAHDHVVCVDNSWPHTELKVGQEYVVESAYSPDGVWLVGYVSMTPVNCNRFQLVAPPSADEEIDCGTKRLYDTEARLILCTECGNEWRFHQDKPVCGPVPTGRPPDMEEPAATASSPALTEATETAAMLNVTGLNLLHHPVLQGEGGKSDYYKLPPGAKELDDLIEFRAMNFNVGNCFKAIYRLGQKDGVGRVYDLRKIVYFALRELLTELRMTVVSSKETA